MKTVTITPAAGRKSLLELLQEKKIYISADCGGRGMCGKCRVHMLSGAPEPTEDEKKIIPSVRLSEGWRLACKCFPENPCEIQLPETGEAEMNIEEAQFGMTPTGHTDGTDGAKTALCVDIGTTTVAAALTDAGTGSILRTASSVNHQRAYGADVISRIQASNDGKGSELTRIIREDVEKLEEQLCGGNKPDEVVISGNTAMEHLYLGYSCETLGRAPYTPVNIELQQRGNVYILPGISAYVGADIACGICACGMVDSDKVTALIDLGTNGEMAVGNRNGIMVASTAAGPAFEGGNISRGTAAVPGAITSVTIKGGKTGLKTIGGGQPTGICGTGVLEAVYELAKNNIIDENGLMNDKYFDTGYPLGGGIYFTQQDVRQVQMAKSAVRAGLEVLMKEYGVKPGDIETLYIAGGFGKKIDISKACGIGLIPPELRESTVAAGNSSLAGAVLFACDKAARASVQTAAKLCSEIDLAGNSDFARIYMEHMGFEVGEPSL